MAKKSALDAKVAEIDTMTAAARAEVERLLGVRAFLTSDTEPANAPAPKAKAKRGRGKAKAKPGLPVFSATEQETGL